MKLLLLESVEGLGRPGDQVDVKAGFARNYLLPQSKAVRVNSDTLRMLGRLQQKAAEEERAMISSMEELAGQIDGYELEVQARATDEGHLFGSITEKEVHLALVAAGWNVSQRQVRMELHLKEAGETEIPLHLYGDVRATIKVSVVPVDLDGTPIELEPEAGEDEQEPGEGEAGSEVRQSPAGEVPEATAKA